MVKTLLLLLLLLLLFGGRTTNPVGVRALPGQAPAN